MLLPAMALMFASCEKDDDSNPTFQENTTGFVLNMPAVAPNNTIDLLATDVLTFTTSQPDYGGIPLRTNYNLEFTLNADAETPTYVSLGEFTTAKIEVSGRKFNDKLIEAWTEAAGEGSVYPSGEVQNVSLRLHANVYGTELGDCYSNAISLNVMATYKAPDIQLPENLFVCGSFVGQGWKSWKPFASVYGLPGNYFTVVYIPAGGEFKWGTYEEEWKGYADFKSFNDEAGAGISDNGGNLKVANAGWYTFMIKAKINGEAIDYTLNVYPAKLYIIGTAAGHTTDWIDSDPNMALTVPADDSEPWVSPAFVGGGEMRAYVKVSDFEWWRTEFTIFNGEVFWRINNIVSNWEETEGAEYSVKPAAGQKLYVNFGTPGTDFIERAEVK